MRRFAFAVALLLPSAALSQQCIAPEAAIRYLSERGFVKMADASNGKFSLQFAQRPDGEWMLFLIAGPDDWCLVATGDRWATSPPTPYAVGDPT